MLSSAQLFRVADSETSLLAASVSIYGFRVTYYNPFREAICLRMLSSLEAGQTNHHQRFTLPMANRSCVLWAADTV